MTDVLSVTQPISKRTPWNKGKIVGAKPPLRPKHVWSIRTKLQVEGRMRDLALFNVAIDSKLRGCDVVALKVDDLAPGGFSADRATVRQKKTSRPVKFELTESTRQAIDDYLRATGKKSGEYPFSGRRLSEHITTRQYARPISLIHRCGNIDHYLGILSGSDLAPDARSITTRMLIEEEDKLSHDLEQLEFAETRAAAGRDRVKHVRGLLSSFGFGTAEREQAERLLVNFENIQTLLEDFCHRLRNRVRGH